MIYFPNTNQEPKRIQKVEKCSFKVEKVKENKSFETSTLLSVFDGLDLIFKLNAHMTFTLQS